MSRVAAVDIGTNSTRLLIADGTEEVARESIVTRLGEGVDGSGRLGDEPQQRVLDVLKRFKAKIGDAPAAAVMTSAVRDASNGEEFAAKVEEALGFPARILSGDAEAQLTFAGATAQREDAGPLLVIDVGGGSTELVIGRGADVSFHVSTQIGVVRHSERHLHSDPPTTAELTELQDHVRAELEAVIPTDHEVSHAIAVAGTPTQCAAIDLQLDHYDPARIEGHILTTEALRSQLQRLSSVPLEARRKTPGLDPQRAPVIVAGIAILLEVVRCFGLDRVAASEHDILWGLALSTASRD